MGRSLIGLHAGLIGGYRGKKAADRADREGKTDTQILKESSREGGKSGALTGAVTGTAFGLGSSLLVRQGLKKYAKTVGTPPIKLTKGAFIGNVIKHGVLGTGFGALGGYLGAKKNTRTRLEKRRKIEDNNRY